MTTPQKLLYVCSAFFIYALYLVTVKIARTGDMPIFEVALFRFLGGAILLWFIAKAKKQTVLVLPSHKKLHLKRAFFAIIGSTLFMCGPKYLPLSEFMAISFSGPIFLTFLVYFFRNERIPALRWYALFVGFSGVLIVSFFAAQPTGVSTPATLISQIGPFTVNMQSLAAIFTLAAAMIGATSDMFVKDLSKVTDPIQIVFTFFLVASIVLLSTAPLYWVTPDLLDFLALIGVVVLGATFQVMFSRSFQMFPASVITPIFYTTLAWGIVFDFVLWHAVPNTAGLIGIGLILIEGFMTYKSLNIRHNPKLSPNNQTQTTELV